MTGWAWPRRWASAPRSAGASGSTSRRRATPPSTCARRASWRGGGSASARWWCSSESRRAADSALAVGAGALGGDAHQDALLGDHRLAVLVPVGMLAGDAAVVADQALHGLGQVLDGHRSLDL